MVEEQNNGAHSARVEMRLVVNGSFIPITHMGGDFLLIAKSSDHPPCEGTVILRVDQTERQWRVSLPQGISKTSNRVAVGLYK
ncbi:MAG: hypothetical protein C5B50_24485 [Verrucomicrobia bacterium]|nr:MAG: hypothetical protein C5B50_24485 [Verrucomicrobiota bacterium]